MRTPLRAIAALTLAGLTIAGAAACDLPTNVLVDGISDPGPVHEVRLTDAGSGDVSVVVDASAAGVDVKRTVHYGQTRPAQTARVDGDVLVLSMSCGSRCGVSYEVHLPAAAKVSGANGSGTITLRGVSDVDVSLQSGDITVERAIGTVQARATSGDIRLTDLSGPVDARTTSGTIEATGLSGASTTVEATSGEIEVERVTVGDVTARTASGDITLRVPPGPYAVNATATSGDVRVEIPTDPAAGHHLEVHATSGDVTVTQR